MKYNSLNKSFYESIELYSYVGEKVLKTITAGTLAVSAIALALYLGHRLKKSSNVSFRGDEGNGDNGYGGGGKGWNPEDDPSPIIPDNPGGLEISYDDFDREVKELLDGELMPS